MTMYNTINVHNIQLVKISILKGSEHTLCQMSSQNQSMINTLMKL